MQLTLFEKQEKFFALENKINIFSGGIQSSKTTTGALRFLMKGLLAHRAKDDNFIVAADVYKTLHQATIPTFKKFCGQYGTMNESRAEFKTHWGSTVFFRTGKIPDSAEGIPRVRRVWLDEGGKVSRYFWENLEGRAAPLSVPIDITTTPYAMNWLAQMVKDARRGKRSDVSIVHCRSVESPYFSKEEYQRQKQLLDPVRFRMKYDGEFGQMEGLVYPHYEQCLIPSKPLEKPTYYAGIDWGYYPDPFCFVIRAVDENRIHYRVNEFYRNHLTIADIVQYCKSVNALYKFKYVVCDPSQPAHIEELNRWGIPAVPANNEIRYGIDVHYALMKDGRFFMFDDQNPLGVDEYSTYHYREQKEMGIDDDLKEKDTLPVGQNDHGIDVDRYLSVFLNTIEADKITPKQIEVQTPLHRMEPEKRIAMLKRRRPLGSGTPYD
jgi:PBSX family phage terminase large subunit